MAQSTVEYSEKVVADLTEKSLIWVLHVDDETGFLKAAKQCLEIQGTFQVDTASSVEEALEKMEQKTYDAVVSDYVMPRKDGLELLKELRDSGNDIPFIIFTVKSREEVAIKALNLGADQYLNKTGHPETVYGQLGHSIQRSVARRRTVEMLRESEEKYRNLVERMPNIIYSLDKAGNVTSVNKAVKTMLGFEPEEIIGKNFTEFAAKDVMPQVMVNSKQIRQGKEITAETTIIDKDGRPHSVEFSSTPIIEDGKVAGSQGIVRDITERKRMEEALRESEEKFRNIFESANDGMIYLDRSGRILNVNRKAAEVCGRSKKELLGKHFTNVGIFSLKDVPTLMRNFARILAGKNPALDIHIKNKKGQEIPLECSASLMKIDDKVVGSMVIARDITEREKMLEELKDSEERLSVLFEFAPDAYYLNDLKGNFVDGNRAAEEITGYKREELIGKSFLKLKLLPRRQILKAAKLLAKNAFGKPTGPDEFVLNRKDSAQVPVEIRTFPVKIKGQTLVLGIARDITKRKKAEDELKMMLEKLKVLNEKLGVVGKLTRHDARNKLSTVTMNVFLAKQKLAGDHEALRHLSEVESACGQVEKIFDFARIYEQLGAEELVYMDVEKIIGQAVMLFSDLHGVRVMNNCRGLTVVADSLLRQLFYNLIDNSLKHGEKVSQIRMYYKKAWKNHAKLIYEDDGVGIPKAEKEKIFKEGYGKDSGYGLYLIRKMCEVYGWTIRETGKQGKGAQFTITIRKMSENGKDSYRLEC